MIDDVLKDGDLLTTSLGASRYTKKNIFIVTDESGKIVQSVRVNVVNSMTDIKADPSRIFGYLHSDLDGVLKADGWIIGEYAGSSEAIMYYKVTSAGRSEIVFNYGGGRHSVGGQVLDKPYYYKFEGPEFGKRTRIFDKETYSKDEFDKALNYETFKLIDGVTGKVWKQ